jgi:hypothetical protein
MCSARFLLMKVSTLVTKAMATGYIFTLKEGQPGHMLEQAIQKAEQMGGKITHKYQ